MTFTKGQTIRLIDASGVPYLNQFTGRDLTVAHYDKDGYLSFAEDTKYGNHEGAWGADRFEAVAAKSKAVEPNNGIKMAPHGALVSSRTLLSARGKDGRFASRTNAPVVLRNGSLYNVARKSKGKRVLQVARLKVLTKEGKTAVMSRHGRLFFAKPEKLTLAPQSDVIAYLQEAKALE